MVLNKKNFLFKIIIFPLFFLLINCSKEKDANLVELDFFRNQGERTILSNTEKNFTKVDIKKIKKLKYLSNAYNFNNDEILKNKLIKKNTEILNTKINSNIIYDNNFIIFVDNKNKLQLFDYNFKNIKTIIFTNKNFFKDLNFKITSSGENIFIATKNGKLFSVNYLNEKKNWEINLGVPIVSNLVSYKKNIFLLNANSKIFSINSFDGIINWSYETVSENFKSLNSYNMLIFRNILVFSNDNGDLIAINLLKNSIIWTLNLRDNSTIDQGKIFEILNSSIDKQYLYISLKNGDFYKVNLLNGSIQWNLKIKLQSSPVFLSKSLISLDISNYLIIIDKLKGTILYSKNLNSYLNELKIKKNIVFSKIIVLSKSLYLLSNNSNINLKIDFSNLDNVKLVSFKYSIIDNFYIRNKNIFFTGRKNLINKININDN